MSSAVSPEAPRRAPAAKARAGYLQLSRPAFKTLKYRPDFPKPFGSPEDARLFFRGFAHVYDNEHRHSGICMLTPATVHSGRAEEVPEP